MKNAKRWRRFFSVGILVVLAMAFLGAQTPARSADPLKVVTTLFPLYDWAREIGGDRVAASLLLPPGVESHSYDPTPRDVAGIHESDLFIYTGKYMEPWVDGLLQGIPNPKFDVVDASQGIELTAERGHGPDSEFEWGGVFQLAAGSYVLDLRQGPDPSMKLVVVPAGEGALSALEAAEDSAGAVLDNPETTLTSGGELQPEERPFVLTLTEPNPRFRLTIPEDGHYAFFMEHGPEEFQARLLDGDQEVRPVVSEAMAAGHGHAHGHGHGHDHGHGHGHDHGHGGKDPHIWLEFTNAARMVDTIAAALIARDPDGREFYAKRADAYQKRLRDLDSRFEAGLSDCRHKTILYAGHFAFGYFARRFGLDHVSPYKGFAPDSEPGPRQIAELTDRMQSGEFRHIFYEEGVEPKIARVISGETGAEMLLLHGAHNLGRDELAEGATYLSIMEDNLVRLRRGLECR